jgi:triosephosphate isomerase (TIM)
MSDRVLIAGNWKMNLDPDEGARFMEQFVLDAAGRAEVLLFPPALTLDSVRRALLEDPPARRVSLGVQNIHPEAAGAFTGEISAEMASAAGAEFVLVGHSERRALFGETLGDTRAKVSAVQRARLVPLLCVGETLEERKRGELERVLVGQLDAVIGTESIRDGVIAGGAFVLAYEPVWAIGTGETATPGDAAEAHALLRSLLSERLSPAVSDRVPILYGGSVKPDNAAELLNAPEVSGVLVGGASLDPESFAAIVRAAG